VRKYLRYSNNCADILLENAVRRFQLDRLLVLEIYSGDRTVYGGEMGEIYYSYHIWNSISSLRVFQLLGDPGRCFQDNFAISGRKLHQNHTHF